MNCQEQLLLSVLPVHVAVEMKNKMLQRLRRPNTETHHHHHHHQTAPTGQPKSAYGRFYDMSVKVHENVRYIGSLTFDLAFR